MHLETRTAPLLSSYPMPRQHTALLNCLDVGESIDPTLNTITVPVRSPTQLLEGIWYGSATTVSPEPDSAIVCRSKSCALAEWFVFIWMIRPARAITPSFPWPLLGRLPWRFGCLMPCHLCLQLLPRWSFVGVFSQLSALSLYPFSGWMGGRRLCPQNSG